jgi:hypothetical protein
MATDESQRSLSWYGYWRNLYGPSLYEFQDNLEPGEHDQKYGIRRLYAVRISRKFAERTVFERSYPTDQTDLPSARIKTAERLLADVCWKTPRLFPYVEGQLSKLGIWGKNGEQRWPLSWPDLWRVNLAKPKAAMGYGRKSIHLPSDAFLRAHWFDEPRVMLVHEKRSSYVLVPVMSAFVGWAPWEIHWALLGMGDFDLKTKNGAVHMDFVMKFMGEDRKVSLTGSKEGTSARGLTGQAIESFAKFAAEVFLSYEAFSPPGGWKKSATWRE